MDPHGSRAVVTLHWLLDRDSMDQLWTASFVPANGTGTLGNWVGYLKSLPPGHLNQPLLLDRLEQLIKP